MTDSSVLAPEVSSGSSTNATSTNASASNASTASNSGTNSGSDSPELWAQDVDREALNKTGMGRALTAEKALAIYRLRPEMKTPGRLRRGAMAHCKIVALQFKVSAKTVREIWSGRSWARITLPEWTKAEVAARSENWDADFEFFHNKNGNNGNGNNNNNGNGNNMMMMNGVGMWSPNNQGMGMGMGMGMNGGMGGIGMGMMHGGMGMIGANGGNMGAMGAINMGNMAPMYFNNMQGQGNPAVAAMGMQAQLGGNMAYGTQMSNQAPNAMGMIPQLGNNTAQYQGIQQQEQQQLMLQQQQHQALLQSYKNVVPQPDFSQTSHQAGSLANTPVASQRPARIPYQNAVPDVNQVGNLGNIAMPSQFNHVQAADIQANVAATNTLAQVPVAGTQINGGVPTSSAGWSNVAPQADLGQGSNLTSIPAVAVTNLNQMHTPPGHNGSNNASQNVSQQLGAQIGLGQNGLTCWQQVGKQQQQQQMVMQQQFAPWLGQQNLLSDPLSSLQRR